MSKRDNILQALKAGCYLELSPRLYLRDPKMPCYKRLVDKFILKTLLDAGLVAETAAGVWELKNENEPILV